MEIKIKQTNATLTPDVAEYLDKKLALLEKFIDPADSTALCEVEVGRSTEHHQSGDIFFCEINVIRGGKQFRARVNEATLMAAIDGTKDALALELGRSNEKERTLSRHAGAAVKAMQKGLEYASDLPRRSVKLATWGKKEFRGYWPFKK